MTRSLAAAVLAALAASVATADVPPPPPPKGKKYVEVASEVKLAEGVKGYVFVLHQQVGPGRPTFTNSKVDLGDAKATTVVTGGRRNYAMLYAVPEGAAKEFKTDKELIDAVTAKKVKGVQAVDFGGTATVSDTVKVDSVTWTYTITGIDEKGIKTEVKGDGVEKAEPKPEKEKKSPVLAEPGYLIGGAAAAVAIALGGLWLVRRRK